MKLITIIPILIFAALAIIFSFYLWQVGPGGKDISQLPSAMIDKPVPPFNLPAIEGRTDGLTTSDLKGKISLVNVWASWCPPCRAEHPILMTLARNGVTIYGINIRDKPENARRFLNQLGNPYSRIGADTNGRVSIDLGVYGYPETFFIDAKGRIRYRHVGAINPGQLESIIRPLLKELSR